MSLQMEKIRALQYAKDLLLELCEPGPALTKKELRRRVRIATKHYPYDYEVIVRPDHPHQDLQKEFDRLKKKMEKKGL